MVWNLEDNSDDRKQIDIYRYVIKQTKNPGFAKTIVRFMDLYDHIKKQNYKSAEELRKDILKNGEPMLSEQEAQQVFELSAMRGGESNYPMVNNVIQQFLSWIYKWSPDVVANFADGFSELKERLQIFKHVREDYALGPIFGMVLDMITQLIPMNVTILENVADQIPFVGPIAGFIATMLASLLIMFNNMLHFAQGDDAGIFVDSFLMIPFIGTSLHKAATVAEHQMTNLAQKREGLIESINTSFGDEQAELLASYIPDFNNLEASLPDPSKLPDFGLQHLDIPTGPILSQLKDLGNKHLPLDGLQQMTDQFNAAKDQVSNLQQTAQGHLDTLKDTAQGHLDTLKDTAQQVSNLRDTAQGQIDTLKNTAQQFTGGMSTKRKWTRRQSRI